MDQNVTDTPKRPTGLIIGGIVLVVLLIVLGLFLPPISLGQRLGWGAGANTETADAPEAMIASELTTPDESALPEGVTLSLNSGDATVAVVPQSEYLSTNAAAASAFPSGVTPVSDVYTVDTGATAATGQVALRVPAEAGDHRTLDLYSWQDDAWTFVPSVVDPNGQQIVTAEGPLAPVLVMAQVAAPENAAVAAAVPSGAELSADVLSQMSEISVGALTLDENGALEGEVTALPDGDYAQYLLVSNVGPIIDQAALSALLSDVAAQENQVNALVQQAVDGGFAGVNLDYQDVPAGQEEAFTTFVQDLADALHAQDLRLALTLGTPAAAGANWDTGGQNWAMLGRAADVVYVKMPLNPTQYDEGDRAAQLLNWATRQIDRQKLVALVNASAVDRLGEAYMALSNEEALANFGELQFTEGAEEVEPGATVAVALSGTAGPLEWDGDSLTYKYSYEQDGQTREVWLGSEAALNHRLQLAKNYNLRGIGVSGMDNVADGTSYAAVFESYRGTAEAPQPTGAAIVWTVRDAGDSVLASQSGNELTFSWDTGASEGDYTINADFALGDSVAALDSLPLTVAAATEETEEVVAEEAPNDAEAADTTEAAAAEDTTSEDTAAAPTFNGDADAVVNVGANVRVGPGLTYGTLSGGADPGTELRLIGRNADASWLNIVLPDGSEGWIFASLVTVNSGVDVNVLEVVEVAPPAPAASRSGGDEAAADGGGGGGSSAAAAPPPPVTAPPVTNAGFELGGQSHSFGNPQLMSYAGMNWVKFQHKWGGPGDDPNGLAGRINQAHGNGFKVLLSIPGQPYPDSIDFGSYVEFLRGVAALGPDAIEVWNEMNIDFEWPAGQIDPASYVNNMLAPAYNAIKSTNGNVMVISGAPAPTGFFGGGCSAQGCDDVAYLNGMAAAGGANYMDCMGVHFNAGATAPGQSTGHPAGSNHYSWYFQPMVDLYYGALGRPLCFTELGYLSGEDFGGVPGRFSWAGDTSVSEHAQWLAQAVSQAANSGKVRLVIIFNVDFTQYGDDPQAGYAMIRPDGSCPSCETLRQVMGR